MDAPPEREDCNPFVKVAALMRDAGVHVPDVVAQDLARGFLLLSDLGTTTYLRALDERNADALFGDAIDALVKWQLASRPTCCRRTTKRCSRASSSFFPSGIWSAISAPRRMPLNASSSMTSSLISSRRISPSRASTCTATTCRAISC